MDQKFLFALTKPGKNGGKFLHFTAVGYYFLLTFGVLFTCIHIVYPAITKNQDEKFWNIVYLSYIFFNMMGNYFMGLFFQSDLKTGIALADPPKSWIYCKECKQHSPPRSHHCSICNACILKHDHHCFFLCQCVGLKNQRYFIIYK
ncbi:unnamed protein product [Clavelina lepadiformis]|uniref:Palmitoyltransferase n=1 Tax=Clavelina lepadiformis TaxID=159417 RepID=A0ABP0GKF7_CLALP